MPYSTFGLSLSMEKSMVDDPMSDHSKQIGFTYGYSLIYLNGAPKPKDKYAEQYQSMSHWYTNPDKRLLQLTAMITGEANMYLNTRLHFALPFGLGVTYAKACDQGIAAPCFGVGIRGSYFVLDRLALYAGYRWIISPKLKYDNTALTNCDMFEFGIAYSLMLN